jgi:hypothetical protein
LVFTLREEHKLRVFENRVLRRIFGPEREEVTGDWRRLHSEELHNLYVSPNIIRVIKSMRNKWEEHVRKQKCIQDSDRKTQLGRHRCSWEDNIRMDLKEKG